MLKFTFLLQHHVRHRLPYAPLIFTHVVESLVFVPIMVSKSTLIYAIVVMARPPRPAGVPAPNRREKALEIGHGGCI